MLTTYEWWNGNHSYFKMRIVIYKFLNLEKIVIYDPSHGEISISVFLRNRSTVAYEMNLLHSYTLDQKTQAIMKC